MDVFVVKAKNPITFFFEFLNIIFNHRVDNSRALYFKTSNLKIKNSYCVGHIDGEKAKFREDLDFKVLDKVVNVFVK